MLLEKLHLKINFLKAKRKLVKMIILSLVGILFFNIKPNKNQIFTKETLYERLEVDELNCPEDEFFSKKNIYENTNSVSKTIAVYCKSKDKRQIEILKSSIDDYSTKIIMDGDFEECGYFLEIFLDFDLKSSFNIDFFRCYQLNSDIFYIISDMFEPKIVFNFKELFINSHAIILGKQILKLILERIKTKLNIFKNKKFNETILIYNPNKINLTLSYEREDLIKLVYFIKCINMMDSHSLGSYYYIPLKHANIPMISTFPFILLLIVYFIYESLFEFENTDHENIKYYILFIIFPFIIVFYLNSKNFKTLCSIIFFYSINFKIGLFYCILVYFRECCKFLKIII